MGATRTTQASDPIDSESQATVCSFPTWGNLRGHTMTEMTEPKQPNSKKIVESSIAKSAQLNILEAANG